jgi:hypothetical protein
MATLPITNVTKTLAEMRSLVFFLINEDDEDFDTTHVDRAINEGLRKVYNLADKDVTTAHFDTLALINQYPIPDAKLAFGNAIVDYVSVDEEELSPGFFTEDLGDNAVPDTFWVEGRVLSLMPVPDDEYSVVVRYRREFEPLDADGEVTDFSDEMIDGAIKYACYLLKIKDEELEVARFFKNEWDEARSSIIAIATGYYASDGREYGGAY